MRQIISLESTAGGVISTYGGVGTHAEFTPDSQTVYITAGNQLLVYSGYTGWTNITPATTAGTPVTDVAITVPAVGAYFAGPDHYRARILPDQHPDHAHQRVQCLLSAGRQLSRNHRPDRRHQ